MKNSDLKKILKQEADKIPISNYQSEILSKVKLNNNMNETPVKKSWFNFKFLSVATAFLLILFAFIFIPTLSNDDNGSNDNISRAKKLLSYELVAVGNVIESDTHLPISLKKQNQEQSEYTTVAQELHTYFEIGHMMINKNNVSISNTLNNNEEFDFEYKLTVDYEDHINHFTSYTLYYSEQKKVDSDKDIDEVSSTLNGILLKNNIQYKVTGEKEVERKEVESSICVFLDDTNKNYIKISQETEVNENEYSYEFYNNGKKTKELSLEVENTKNKKSMEIEILENGIQKVFEYNYYVKNDKMICSYESNKISIERIVVQIKQESCIYIFFDNSDNEICIEIKR